MPSPPVSKTSDPIRTNPYIFVLFVLVTVVFATILRWSLNPFLGPTATPFITYFISVILCAWLFGFVGGAAATVSSAFAANYFFMLPLYSLNIGNTVQLSGLVLFVLEGIAISLLGQSQFNSRNSSAAIAAAAEDRARRAMALNVIGKAILDTRELDIIQETALAQLAKTLEVDRCLVVLLDKSRDWASFVAEWRRPDLPPITGQYSLANFDVQLDAVFP